LHALRKELHGALVVHYDGAVSPAHDDTLIEDV
jgi:hypothetical protein